ncbi:glycosyltransferase [Leptolyngbya sp. FACHB-711]|uniref:glycosyltransferase family 2 protein n=1 Tax=Leptolyngbya sp. FACHB-711 TaxID=2692813 RepID=UPI001688F9D9|nr:glycosyltransferase [Leptolyngbya sp. FACHB-711]MBD2028357.1 glycosyltransferase [Leptolyngbya sp. FACHB-711]
MNQNYKVSVVLPVFNAENFIAKSVRSILNQTFTNFEFLIIDDGSTDRTFDIIRSLENEDSRIRIFRTSNRGIVDALNFGILHSSGKYIARMDADDIALPQRFEKQVDFLDKNSNYVIVGNSIGAIDQRGRFLGNFITGQLGPFSPGEDEVSRILNVGAFLLHPTVMYRKDVALRIGGYRKEYEWIEDADFYNRIIKEGFAYCLPEVLLHYRVHLKSVTRTKSHTQQILKHKLAVEMGGSKSLLLSEGIEKFSDTEASQEYQLNFLRQWSYLSNRHGGGKLTSLSLLLEALAIAPFSKKNWITLLLILFGDNFVALLVLIRKKLFPNLATGV